MKVPLFDIKKQNAHVREAALKAFERVYDSGQFILGDEMVRFEEAIERYLNVPHAVGVSSGTDALLIALMAIGIGPGDEVLCPSFTFFSTAGSVARLGARPVFVDVDLDTYCLSVQDAENKCTSRTKAIIPVHLFGQMSDMQAIKILAQKHHLRIIEDCAQSFGASQNHHQSGTMGDIGCFSFFPTKNLGGFGDSGLVCAHDADLAERLKMLRMHGMKPQYYHHVIGGNFRMDALQAALLAEKLPFVEEYIACRQRNARLYQEQLKDVPGLILPKTGDGNVHTWNQFTVRILHGRREEVKQGLLEAGVGCNIYYPLPLDQQPCFQAMVAKKARTPHAHQLSQEVLSLPIFPELTTDEIEYVASVLREKLMK